MGSPEPDTRASIKCGTCEFSAQTLRSDRRGRRGIPRLRDQVVDHLAADVGEAEVAAVVAVGELLVVDAE